MLSPSSIAASDRDIVPVYTNGDIVRMWHSVAGTTRNRDLGSALINYAINGNLISFPPADMLTNVSTILNSPCDPWAWTLSAINDGSNSVLSLNAFHNPVPMPYLPRSILDVRRFLRPVDVENTITTITTRLPSTPRSLLPVSSPAASLTAHSLQHLHITAAGLVQGPVIGGAALCTDTETQIIGHRLIFDSSRSAPSMQLGPNLSLNDVVHGLDLLDDLIIFLLAPGMAMDSDDTSARIILPLDISVHISQAYDRLAGARP
ncbi:unnamed protein product [Tilletia controversa]|uniref:Uncharacterized protein n=3 Tax=Tilletia TaxID=13289 RepID=A0A8X7MIC3_9BASI|nr:hypothetical protein CF336_g9472 [Tilletia laevis]KAE8180064.1 hypothetical protein CF328_g9283 [Tilletia controversa]KAE8236410.1 hypothetical protein A4X03_0g9446 [Tilletia caries]KAE8180183.1 hypothetical protein CF335_g9333 [Tilletia laevis]KAE8236293.1 hypothetical protein A4X06_0g9598 [Tilletia controversa]